MKRITILFLIIILTFLFTLSAFALTKEERTWKEDILTLLSLVKRAGDYSEVVDLIEVAPALKKDPEIKKAYVDFAPPGVTPPEWAREEKQAPPVIKEVPREREVKREVPPEIGEKEKKRSLAEEEALRIARQVAAQRKEEKAKIEAPKEVEIITEGPPEKIATAETAHKAAGQQRPRQKEEEVTEKLGVIPTPLPSGAKVVHSTDVVSKVKAEMVGGKMRVTIALSGEREYKVSERTRPPSIVINIPHTINAVAPETIPKNKGCLRTIKVIQHRYFPVDETRITVILNRWTEYRITHKNNEIYIDFEE